MNISRDIKQKFYQSKNWRLIRDYKLKISPHCECDICKEYRSGYEYPAQEVHHIIDIDKDWNKRLELSNLMSINKNCHSRITMNEIKNKRKEKINKSLYDEITERLMKVCKIEDK